MKKLLLALGLIATTSAAFATSYQLYNQPNEQAKVIGQLSDQAQNQYIQFYQKGDWVKVANTANGQVGWVNVKQVQQNTQDQQYQQALKAIEAQRAQLKAQRQQFEQNYQQAVSQLQQKVANLQQQYQQMQNQANMNETAQKKTANQDNAVVQQSFESVMVNTNKDGKTATVTKKWLGKDGKMHQQTKQVPLDQVQNINFPA
ncbi:SH3 domain-containing protein [Facilibium subflavum]|uniref:SH3 domain-containing protein n=1 Tax=Facilibium subflavum TaxID=2219058 RepID=UPI000E64DBE8|nr:SH3 domain-containing protein [Facilibium subflavum]